MFQLAIIRDTIKVPPASFNRGQIEVLTEEVDRKYANRVVMDVGLGICLYDFVEIGDAYLYPSDGAAHHRVTFRLLVFRPFVGEVLVGRVKSCNENGIRVSLGFFDDIFVPSYLLQTPSEFDAREKVWVWTYNSDEAGEPAVRYPMEIDEPIRLRVRSVNFTHVKQGGGGSSTSTTTTTTTTAAGSGGAVGVPVAGAGGGGGGGGGGGPGTPKGGASEENLMAAALLRRPRSDTLTGEEVTGGPPAPMSVMGTTNDDGLGMVSWWG